PLRWAAETVATDHKGTSATAPNIADNHPPRASCRRAHRCRRDGARARSGSARERSGSRHTSSLPEQPLADDRAVKPAAVGDMGEGNRVALTPAKGIERRERNTKEHRTLGAGHHLEVV